jgi:hypothetical protein
MQVFTSSLTALVAPNPHLMSVSKTVSDVIVIVLHYACCVSIHCVQSLSVTDNYLTIYPTSK